MKGGYRLTAVGQQAHGGFTLLEALVAMAIAAVAFTALYRTVGQSSKVVLDVESRVEAAMVARSVLASATFAEDLVALQSGQDGPWQWRTQVMQEAVPMASATGQPIDPPPIPAARVTVQVARDGASPMFELIGWKPFRNAP